MAKGQRAGDAPIGVNVLEGKSYYWCTCGKSSKQPFCDGSHQGTSFQPQKVVLEEDKNVAFCQCKHSANGAFCDGAHAVFKSLSCS